MCITALTTIKSNYLVIDVVVDLQTHMATHVSHNQI